MKTLKFNQELVEPILSGNKIKTWRLFDDKNLSLGDKLELIVRETGKSFANVEVTHISEKRIMEMEEEDCKGNGDYTNTDEVVGVLVKHYGERVNKETLVKIITFKLI